MFLLQRADMLLQNGCCIGVISQDVSQTAKWGDRDDAFETLLACSGNKSNGFSCRLAGGPNRRNEVTENVGTGDLDCPKAQIPFACRGTLAALL